LTQEPWGHNIQLRKVLTVAIPSKLVLPSNIAPDGTGVKMLTPKGVSILFFGVLGGDGRAGLAPQPPEIALESLGLRELY
jgi:hypothetical protein